VFEWAREANPTQPLTSGVWAVDTSPDGANLGELQQIQLRESDIVTFHNYSWPEYFKRQVAWLKKYNRPVICTEFMARSVGSTFDTVLPIAKEEPLKLELQHFVECIRAQQTPMVSGESAKRALDLAFEITRQIQANR